jgi:hypothetical protein
MTPTQSHIMPTTQTRRYSDRTLLAYLRGPENGLSVTLFYGASELSFSWRYKFEALACS